MTSKHRPAGGFQDQSLVRGLTLTVVGCLQALNRSSAPEPTNMTLFGERFFADVIQLRILRWGNDPGLPG